MEFMVLGFVNRLDSECTTSLGHFATNQLLRNGQACFAGKTLPNKVITVVNQVQELGPRNVAKRLGVNAVPMFGIQIWARGHALIRGSKFWNAFWCALHATASEFEEVNKAEHFVSDFEHEGTVVKWQRLRGSRLGKTVFPESFNQTVVRRHVREARFSCTALST